MLKYCIFLLLPVWPFSSVCAQSLLESMGGVDTHFTILDHDVKIPILAQAIVERGYYDYDHNAYSDGAYGYGYGLQTYFLEFATSTTLYESHEYEQEDNGQFYEIKLIDENKQPLLITKLNKDDVRAVSNGAKLTTYTFNLYDVPLILLNKAVEINIRKMIAYKRKQ